MGQGEVWQQGVQLVRSSVYKGAADIFSLLLYDSFKLKTKVWQFSLFKVQIPFNQRIYRLWHVNVESLRRISQTCVFSNALQHTLYMIIFACQYWNFKYFIMTLCQWGGGGEERLHWIGCPTQLEGGSVSQEEIYWSKLRLTVFLSKITSFILLFFYSRLMNHTCI